jgi:hypothetical protein
VSRGCEASRHTVGAVLGMGDCASASSSPRPCAEPHMHIFSLENGVCSRQRTDAVAPAGARRRGRATDERERAASLSLQALHIPVIAMGLVDYSDSEDEDPAPGAAPTMAPPPAKIVQPAPPAAARAGASSTADAPEPPAKRAKKPINLAHLLRKNDAELPFDEVSHLPADFFDNTPREPDAGEATAGAEAPTRGWAALSAMLPAPKNQQKSGKSSAALLYSRAQPLHRKASAAAAVEPASSSSSSSLPVVASSAARDSEASGVCVGAASSYAGMRADEVDERAASATGAHSGVAAVPAGAPSLLPQLRPGLYDPVAEPEPEPAAPGMMYEAPVGPAMGPAVGLYPGVDDGAGAYAEAPAYYEGMDEANTVSVSQDELRRAMGAQKQYDFMVPPPKEEVKIAATVWNRQTGGMEQQYQASSTQKRKHQITALAADAAMRSAEITARGSKGLKSKKETAAKYGW